MVHFSLAVTVSLVIGLAQAFPGTVLKSRQELRTSYDFVIVGGGTAGLTIARRLTEDSKVNVLVIEAGPILNGQTELDNLLVPGTALPKFGALPYYWNVVPLPEAQLNNRAGPPFVPKIVGGGSAVNVMVWDIGSKRDYDDWASYTGFSEWGWSGIQPYIKKSETFTPPPANIQTEYGVTFDSSAHGYSGQISSKYPDWFWKNYKIWDNAYKSLGIPKPKDHYTGEKTGRQYIVASIRKDNVRSYAKNGYYDSVKTRGNLHLLTDTQVTKILFNSHKVATGVQYSSGAGAPTFTINASKEVILSAGAIQSVHLLQLSGIGDANLLNRLKIPIVSTVPGVGNNLQDHTFSELAVTTNDPTIPNPTFINQTLFDQEYAKFVASRSGILTVAGDTQEAFLSLGQISSKSTQLINGAKANDGTQYLRSGVPPTVAAGYKKQQALILASVASGKSPLHEQIKFLHAQIKPLSRGFVEITSKDPFAPATLNWRTFSHPFDAQVAVESLKYVRKVNQTPFIQALQPVETSPGPSVTTDAQILAHLKANITPTFFHLSCTNQLGRLEDGGVVDRKLNVYGVSRLRIADASVIPIIPATHTQHTVYAIAEKAADIIKKEYNLK